MAEQSKTLTQDQINTYLKVNGEMCPKCKSPEVDTDSLLFLDDESGKVYQDKMCLSCYYEWTDVFGLEGVKTGVAI